VEDNLNDAELTLAALGELNLVNQVDVARDGAEALEYVRKQGAFAGRSSGDPVVMLLDLKMPKVDGLEVLRQLKDDPALRSIPVVILTSSREERDLVEGYRLGVNAYVVKPVDFQQFAEAVRRLGVFWALVNEPPPGAAAGGATSG
jgi:CheY-like chemotaxis protein